MPAILINFIMQITTIKYGGLSSGVMTLLAACFLLVGLSAHGEIYKWTDEQGQLHFSDKAPESGVAESIGDQLMIIKVAKLQRLNFWISEMLCERKMPVSNVRLW